MGFQEMDNSIKLKDLRVQLMAFNAKFKAAGKPFWKSVAIYIADLTLKIFQSEGSEGGRQKWQPLAQSTQKQRLTKDRTKGKGKNKISISGLRGAENILHPRGASGWLGTFQTLGFDDNNWEFGSPMKVNGLQLSAIHQHGNSKLPERKHIGLVRNDLSKLETMRKLFYGYGK